MWLYRLASSALRHREQEVSVSFQNTQNHREKTYPSSKASRRSAQNEPTGLLSNSTRHYLGIAHANWRLTAITQMTAIS
jgi:hypothetical protein